MAGNPHPVFVDNVAPEKANARAYLPLRLGNADALRGLDGSTFWLCFIHDLRSFFYRDTSDTTTADDGLEVILDANGARWKLAGGAGIQIDAAGPVNDSPSSRDAFDGEEAGFTYLGTDTELLYVRLTAGGWSSGLSLRGPTGAAGATGATGATGAAGSNGANGADGADGSDPGILLTWDTGTTDADPGSGKIRANNASLASASVLYISKDNRAGDDISAFLAALDDSTNTAKGTLVLTKPSDDTQASFTVGAVTDATGYIKLAVSNPSGATSFSAADPISFQFSRAGDKGSDGSGSVSSVNGAMGAVVLDAGDIEYGADSPAITVEDALDTLFNGQLGKSILDYGADNTGATSNFGTAFNSAMTALSALGSGIRNAPTLYIPAGFYKIGSTVPKWLPFVNIVADPGAYIQADESISAMITTDAGGSPATTLQYISLVGGQWDGNSNVTYGFLIKDYFQLVLSDFRMYACNSASGGFIGLGDDSADFTTAITIQRASMYNFGSDTPDIVSGNYGIKTVNSGGSSNSTFSQLDIVGCERGISGKFASGSFDKVHPWCYADQGSIEYGIYLQDFGARLTQCEVDGPIASGKAGFRFAGSAAVYVMHGCEVNESSNDNIGYAVEIDSGTLVSASCNYFHGLDSSHRLAADYHGTLTGLHNLGDRTANVVSVHQQVRGQQNNNAAATGCLGELLSQFTSSVSMSNGTAKTVTSKALTAGVWLVWAQIDSVPAGSTTTSNVQVSISTTDNTEDFAHMTSLTVSMGAGLTQRFIGPPTVILSAGSTTAYAVLNVSFAVSTMTARGTIFALRVG